MVLVTLISILANILVRIDTSEGCSPAQNTFQCPQYNSWDPRPWTYVVPVGNFCYSKHNAPVLPDYCTENECREAPKILIHDGEGTECMIKMYNSPGKIWSIGLRE